MTPVEELIDGGVNCRPYGGLVGVFPGRCARSGCVQPPHEGHGFCRDCLAWLREETDDDPLADGDDA